MERDVEMDNLNRTIHPGHLRFPFIVQVLTNPSFGPLGIPNPSSEIIDVRSPFQKS